LLVAGILAVLAAFAVPNLLGTAQRAQIKLVEAEIGRNGPIAKGLNNYKFDMGSFPETDEGLEALFQRKEQVDDERYGGPYIDGPYEELRDAWSNAYHYRSPGEVNEDGYDIWSAGPDGKNDEGQEGSDDVKNWREQ
jgi:general secretion pathway protein G